MKENYIVCSVEECTHARLASGEVVEAKPSKVRTREKYILGDMVLYNKHWEQLSITPVKLAPEPEPRKWEFEKFVCTCVDATKWVYVPDEIPAHIPVRVTLEEIL